MKVRSDRYCGGVVREYQTITFEPEENDHNWQIPELHNALRVVERWQRRAFAESKIKPDLADWHMINFNVLNCNKVEITVSAGSCG